MQGWFGLPPYYAKVFGEPGETAVFTDPSLKPNIDALIAKSPYWRNEFTPRFYLALPRFKLEAAQAITMPFLVCLADREVYGNPAFPAKIGQLAPRGEVLHYPAGHFDFYHGILDQVASDEIDFLRQHLVA